MRRAVILAGSAGTGLRPYMTVLPKPLMPVGDRPILDNVIRQLAGARFERVTGYVEKPMLSYEVSLGVYCFAPRVREHIPPGQRLDFPDLIMKLIATGEKVRAWCSQDHWLDIGRPDHYEQAQDDCERMRSRLLLNG